MYYRGAAAAIIVYDITSASTFKEAQRWVDELRREGTDGVILALAGNKLDKDADREVPKADALDYAEKNSLIFAETSAKTGFGISQLFVAIGNIFFAHIFSATTPFSGTRTR